MKMTVDIDEQDIWIEVDYHVTGYDPGNTCGPPDRCYPAEGEIEIDSIEILKIDGVEANLTLEESNALAARIEEKYSEKIDEKAWENYDPYTGEDNDW